MNTRQILCITGLGTALLLAGCDPTTGGRYSRRYPSYRTSDPYYGGAPDPYYSGAPDPYYGRTPAPYYDPYYNARSRAEEYRDREREHEEHEKLEQKYDKAMNRLDRQEREAEEKLYRKSGGNSADPRFRDGHLVQIPD